MGNTVRVVGIVLVSMLLGVTSFALVIFTICGGFESSNQESALLLGVAFVVLFGGVAAIVWLARGITSSRPHDGLAVPPAAPPAPATPVRRERLTGSGLQLLIVLRIVLAVYIVAALAAMASSFSYLRGADLFTALRFVVPGFLNVLPPALALLLLCFNPPPAAALDLAAGSSIASMIWRAISLVRFLINAYSAVMTLPFYLLQVALFTLADIAIVGLSLAVRRRVETGNYWRLVVAVFAFLFFEWFVQMVMLLSS